MNNLDDKLKEILNGYFEGASIEPINDDQDKVAAITDIRQAFADEGYEKRVLGRDFTARVDMKEVMTGQEWYDRFGREYPMYPDTNQQSHLLQSKIREEALEAAKRASGVNNAE